MSVVVLRHFHVVFDVDVLDLNNYHHDKQSEANNFQKTLETRNTISDDKNLHFLPGASFVAR